MKVINKRFSITKFRIGKYNSIVVYEKNLQGAIQPVKKSLRKASNLLSTKNDIVIFITASDSAFLKDSMGGSAGATSDGYAMSLRINPKSRA